MAARYPRCKLCGLTCKYSLIVVASLYFAILFFILPHMEHLSNLGMNGNGFQLIAGDITRVVKSLPHTTTASMNQIQKERVESNVSPEGTSTKTSNELGNTTYPAADVQHEASSNPSEATEIGSRAAAKLSVTDESGAQVFPIRVYGMVRDTRILQDGSKDFVFDWIGSKYFSVCPYSNCNFTDSHDKARVVVVEMMALERHLGPPPLPRIEGQLWIAFTWEPPSILHADFWKKLQTEFHLTASYQTSSDIFVPFGSYVNRKDLTETAEEHATQHDIRNKTKLVAWFVSNCNTQSNRAKYVEELQKYVQVDVYGRCGNLSCLSPFIRTVGMHPCRRMLLSQYKFYLAFENALCTDWITEKVWSQLGLVVPIVMGNVNYTRELPPNSFIDIRDFSSAKQLADYLHFLDRNYEEYVKYFDWVQVYEARYKRYIQNWRCKVCEYLNTHTFTPDQLQNPRANFNPIANETYSCQASEDYYKNHLI